MARAARDLEPEDAYAIFSRWREERVGNGIQYDGWVRQVAAEYGCSMVAVKRAVSEGQYVLIQQAGDRAKNEFHEAAELMGAGALDAIDVLRCQLKAKKRRPLTDKNGRLKRDCPACGGLGEIKVPGEGKKQTTETCEKCGGTGGEIVWLETDDNPSQIAAAKALLEVAGAAAPREVHVSGEIVFQQATVAELKTAARRLNRELGRILDARPEQEDRPATPDQDRIPDPACVEGPLLLADGTHADEGRAGSG